MCKKQALACTGYGKISGTLTSGNIGINKTPTCALDVTGDGKISGTLTANNLIISGGLTFDNVTTGNITNTNKITTGSLEVTNSTSTGSLTASGSITGETYCKIGNHTVDGDGIFIAGRSKSFLPSPNDPPEKIQIQRG